VHERSGDGAVRAVEDKTVIRQVYVAAMALQHVEPKEHVHVLVTEPLAIRVHDSEGTREMAAGDFYFGKVNSSQYFTRPNSNSRTLKSIIQEMEKPTSTFPLLALLDFFQRKFSACAKTSAYAKGQAGEKYMHLLVRKVG